MKKSERPITLVCPCCGAEDKSYKEGDIVRPTKRPNFEKGQELILKKDSGWVGQEKLIVVYFVGFRGDYSARVKLHSPTSRHETTVRIRSLRKTRKV